MLCKRSTQPPEKSKSTKTFIPILSVFEHLKHSVNNFRLNLPNLMIKSILNTFYMPSFYCYLKGQQDFVQCFPISLILQF